jgi:hypothetical protein
VKIAFLFPGSGPHEALDNWVRTISRHTKHEVSLLRTVYDCQGHDFVFVLTENNTYPAVRVNNDLNLLRERHMLFAVVHNNDAPAQHRSGLPVPGHYPSFCWTQKSRERLKDYEPILMRQPVLPPIAPSYDGSLLLGTFGHAEPKKQTWEMASWAKQNGVPFLVVRPDVLNDNEAYIADLQTSGCSLITHPWLETVEELAPLLLGCTHFLFVVTDSKKGTGGCPTSPRFAGLFNRPVIVVDDEDTYKQDGFYVYDSLSAIQPDDLAAMKPPRYDWSPDAYLEALAEVTKDFWKGEP